MDEKITIAEAIEHFKGEVYAAQVWLARFGPNGKPRDRRPDTNVDEFRRKLKMRSWVVEQLMAAQQRKGKDDV